MTRRRSSYVAPKSGGLVDRLALCDPRLHGARSPQGDDPE